GARRREQHIFQIYVVGKVSLGRRRRADGRRFIAVRLRGGDPWGECLRGGEQRVQGEGPAESNASRCTKGNEYHAFGVHIVGTPFVWRMVRRKQRSEALLLGGPLQSHWRGWEEPEGRLLQRARIPGRLRSQAAKCLCTLCKGAAGFLL